MLSDAARGRGMIRMRQKSSAEEAEAVDGNHMLLDPLLASSSSCHTMGVDFCLLQSAEGSVRARGGNWGPVRV